MDIGDQGGVSAGSDATGAYAITLSRTQTAASVTFKDGTPTLTGGTLSLVSGSITAQYGSDRNHRNAIDSSAGSLRAGANLILTSNEAYSGGTTIGAGTLQLGDGGTTGMLPTARRLLRMVRLSSIETTP